MRRRGADDGACTAMSCSSRATPPRSESFDTAVSTPGSPSFRHYLAPGAFAAEFGPSPATIAAVRAWLAGRGLRVGPTSGDGLIVPISGTAAQIDRAFDVGLEQYRLPSGRVVRVARRRRRWCPSALAGALDGITGLDDLSRPVPELVRSAPARPRPGRWRAGHRARRRGRSPRAARARAPTAGCARHASSPTPASAGALTVDQLASAYSFSSLYPGTEGSGVTVGIYELEPFLRATSTPSRAATHRPSPRR